jgi:hypothetical protein
VENKKACTQNRVFENELMAWVWQNAYVTKRRSSTKNQST